MFVIAGASGNAGRIVAERLLAEKKRVRVLGRSAEKLKSWAARGADVVTLSLEDDQALEKALRGAEGAFLLSPPDPKANDFIAQSRKLVEGMAQAARRAGVGHVVFLSSNGAQHADGTGIVRSVHNGEKAFEAVGIPATFVRAAYFVENWGAVLPVAKQEGVLPSFLAQSKLIPMVATRDIGETAARALLDGPAKRRILELSGPVDVSPDDVAEVLSRLLAKPVNVVEAPLDAVVPTFVSFGISENVASLYRELYEGLGNGRVAFEGGTAVSVRGRETLESTLKTLLG